MRVPAKKGRDLNHGLRERATTWGTSWQKEHELSRPDGVAERGRVLVGQLRSDMALDGSRIGLPHFFCMVRPAGVIATNWPRPSTGQVCRWARPASTSRSINRDVEYCGSSSCFSSSTGRSAPCGERDSSSSASYQESGGKPAFFRSCSTAASGACCTRTRRAQADVVSGEGFRLICKCLGAKIGLSCTCINLDGFNANASTFMQVHEHAPVRRPCPFFDPEEYMKLFYMPGACSLAPHIAFRRPGCRSSSC